MLWATFLRCFFNNIDFQCILSTLTSCFTRYMDRLSCEENYYLSACIFVLSSYWVVYNCDCWSCFMFSIYSDSSKSPLSSTTAFPISHSSLTISPRQLATQVVNAFIVCYSVSEYLWQYCLKIGLEFIDYTELQDSRFSNADDVIDGRSQKN